MSKPADVAPTRGTNAASYEWILEVGVIPPGGGAVDYELIPDITSLAPNSSPTTTDAATYANKGQQDQSTIGEGFNLAVDVKVVTDEIGEVIPGLAILIEAANALLDQDLVANRVISIRYYHYKIAALAYEFTAEVAWSRRNSGNAENEFMSFTLTSKGDRKVIENPATTPAAAAVLTEATPTGATEGEIVKIIGTGMKGATAVKFGATAATMFAYVNGAIYATLPAGAAGSAAITVTTSAGDSNALEYTRA